MHKIFEPLQVGALTLPNRIIMAPLTRMRSKQAGNIPHQLNAEYYAQRASAGLIISEATQISQQGQGYPATPGIHSKEQVEGWKLVTKEVHKNGGRIFLQLWHVGRVSHISHQENNALPVAPSAIKAQGGTFSKDWKPVALETPRALEISEIKDIIFDFKIAAQNAKDAGFDGVEIHAANGYLIDQFLQDGSNKRTDEYGGSIANRSRFLLEVLDEVSQVWSLDRIGVRLSPYGSFNDMQDSDPIALFSYVLQKLNDKKIAFIDLIEPRSTEAGGKDSNIIEAPNAAELFRKNFSGILISAGGYNPEMAKETIAANKADAISFGRWFISNPDLVKRIETGADLNKYDRTTFYGGAEKGYTDYPTL
jgi:N-ethylmaleimide reductase